ncbi:response regulator [Actinoplanes sp. NPDC051513]|uniref:response regulator n=1 Tax=Actinoplanes sp. NPDC051513 TaxID=3363908 RepID=UPI00378D241C
MPDSDPAALRVLLVEDDEDDVLLCRDAIAHGSVRCRLEVADTLQTAIQHLERDGADVALVDLSLPDAQDLQAVTVLTERFDGLPIVVLTGLHDEETAARALHAGAEDYLVKGATSDAIGRAMRYAIERKRVEENRRARQAAEMAKHRAEQTARELEHNYRQLFDSNPYPMFVFDTEALGFLEVNDAAASYYGYPRPDLLALDITRLCLPEDVAMLTEAIADAGAVDRWGPLRHVKRDGTVVEVNLTSHALSFNGRPARCAVIEDITEKEHLERRLRQSQRLESLGQLAGGVAHDFNNLLNIIIGYATMCVRDLEDAGQDDPRWLPMRDDLQQIVRAGDRATNLTRQLLSFARAEVSPRQIIDLNAVVHGMEELLRRTIGEDIDLITRPADEVWPVRADPGQIEQVLLNLVVNARDAMPTGGTITVQVDAFMADEYYAAYHPGVDVGRHMRLRVTDTGTGMSQTTIDRAFEPFFTTKPKGQGTGLGLATIYGIVTQTGGHAQITSEVGMGTTFTASFPVTEQTVDEQAQTPPDARDPDPPHRPRETILLAEDEDSLRLLTHRILTRHGYTVIAACNGQEALELASQHAASIDLVLTDVIMPQMNGHDLACRLQAAHPGLPVIYMSGYAEPMLASRSTLPAGVNLLSKPISEHQILAALRRELDTRRHGTRQSAPGPAN